MTLHTTPPSTRIFASRPPSSSIPLGRLITVELRKAFDTRSAA
jgi:hypothetical protein